MNNLGRFLEFVSLIDEKCNTPLQVINLVFSENCWEVLYYFFKNGSFVAKLVFTSNNQEFGSLSVLYQNINIELIGYFLVRIVILIVETRRVPDII